MRSLSIRWKLLLPTMSLAAVVAVLFVALLHARTREGMTGQLERTLATKCEEVQTVLSAGNERIDLETFLEVETRYSSSPYEYFYEIVDERGEPLLASHNLAGRRLAAPPDDGEEVTVPHPLQPQASVRLRRETLPGSALGAAPVLLVAVTLAPLESALRADLARALQGAALALLALLGALWIAVGRTLRRVGAITGRATRITSTNLRERLPVNDSGDEIDELSRVFNEMLAGLEGALRQMEAFTSDAAHQLRTPLTRVRGELDLVLREGVELSPAARERLEAMRDEIERLSTTCSRLLLLARLDRGEQDLLVDDVELGVTASDLVEQFSPHAAERGVELRYDGAGPVHVRGSRPLLVEALANLLDNALRVSDRGRAVELSVRRTEEEALLIVADQGPGIPEDFREHLFRRFARRASRPDDVGTGLGLAIVKGIARAHGGDARVETSRWGGAAFVIALPLAESFTRFSTGTKPTLSPAR